MARAKRTDRAEARRRYRAYQATQAAAAAAGEALDTPEPPVADATARRTRTAAGPAGGQPDTPRQGRVGFIDAFRLSFRPWNLTEDLRTFPAVARGSKAVWLPSLVTIVAAVVLTLPGAASNEVIRLVVPPFLWPPYASAFLAGILSPRASYLSGGVVGIVAVVALSAAIGVQPIAGTPQTGEPYTLATAVNLMFVTIPSAMAIAAFAAFYKRLLRLSSQGRQAAARRGTPTKPARARR